MKPVGYALHKEPTSPSERQKKRDGKRWRGVWYVRWKKPDGTYTSKKSTGHTNRADAKQWAEDHLAETFLGPDTQLSRYVAGFFYWPDGRYVRDRTKANKRVSYRSAQSHRLDYENHVKRILGDPKLADIGKQDTVRLRDALYDEGLAPATVNHCLNTLSVILQAAEFDDLIERAPPIYRLGGKGKSRGVLSVDEARELFTKGTWRDDRERIASLVAAATGLRQSEILGLTRDRVHRGHLDISRVWDGNAYRLKESTKSGDARVVPISKGIRRELARLIVSNPHGRRGFVFWHDTNPREPIEGLRVTRGLYAALESIGMSEERRKELRIDFHSWRHFANSRDVEAGLAETTVRAMIGHKSAEMTLNYYHQQDVERIAGIQDSLTADQLRIVK